MSFEARLEQSVEIDSSQADPLRRGLISSRNFKDVVFDHNTFGTIFHMSWSNLKVLLVETIIIKHHILKHHIPELRIIAESEAEREMFA